MIEFFDEEMQCPEPEEEECPDDMETYIADRIARGLIDADGKPLKCEFCGSRNFETTDIMAGPMGWEEYTLICADCRELAGHWSYGSWAI